VEGIRQVAKDKDPFQIGARNLEADGVGPRGHDQDIVRDAGPVGKGDLTLHGIDPVNPRPDPDVNTCFLERFRCPDDQSIIILDYITDVIGYRSSGIRNEIAPFDHGDVE